MKITIFYSWQSTIESKYNRYFILDCIKKAVEQIKQKYNSIEVKITEALRDESGQISIPETIAEKIENCHIFIADMTIINNDGASAKTKYTPNPNVLLEYGQAIAHIGKSQIISVLNSKFGSPHNDPELIPFDIRSDRFPIEYSINEEIYTDKEKREKEKNELTKHLSGALDITISKIIREQKNKYRPFKTWEQWKDEINIQNEFIENKKIKEIRDTIMKEIDNPNKSPIRITGLSGIGKTRILFEIFRKIEGDEKTILLSNRVLYLNYDDFSNNHLEIINTINREKSDAILIIDNCNADGYEKFIRNLKGFKLSLISIDSNPEENYEDSQYIKIGNEDLLDSIEDIIKAKSDNLEQSTIEIIKQISQGVPLIAILLCENIVNGKLTKEPDNKGLLDKILGKKGEKWRYILDSCSLFRKVGYENEKKEQYNFIVTNENLTISNNNHIVRLKESEEAVKYYIKRGIFEKRGRYLSIRPFFLSVLLASKYLESISSEHFHNIIKDIQDKLEKPHKEELMNYLSEQIRYLGYNTDIRTIIDNFVGYKSYFDSIEVLNTELGSRLFRSFVEVNPVAISDNFYRQFNNEKTEKLLEFKEGRRNIIWALEKLCFNKDTFSNSAKILYRFAVAENESWANNATGQFLQLFHIFLAGTEVSLKERLKIIKWGLGMKDEKFTQLAIKAMASGLTTNHFARMKGAERQGIDEIKDYVPIYDVEISEYYNSILDELINLIRSEGIYIDEVSKIIADSIRGLTNIGLIAIVLPYIDDVIAIKNGIWQEGLDSIRMTLAFEGNKILEEHRTHLQKIIEELSKDFMTRFRSYDKFYDKNYSLEKFEEKEKERMYSLAKVFMEFKEVEQRELLSKLYKRERGIYVIYQSYFGKSISDFFNDNIDKSEKFINISLSIAEELGEELFDYSILLGFIEQSEREIKKYFYQKVGEKSYLNYLLFIFVANDEKGVEHFDQLFKLIDNHPQLFSYLGHLKYRMALQKLSIQEIESLQNKLLNYEIQGYIMIFELLSSIRTQDAEKQIVIDGFLKECIYKIGVQWNNNIDNFQYFNHIRNILKNEEKDEKLCSFVVNDIINYINWDTALSLEPYRSIFEIALSDYFDSTWAIISSAIINEHDGYMKFWGIKQLLGEHINNIYTKKDILFNNNIEKIIDWCNKNQPIAPTLIAELVPIYNEDRTEWNPIAKRLIDEFGSIKEVLHGLEANMNSFSWSGSIVPLLESNKKLLESIVDNSNPIVSEWAQQNINELSKRIIQEKKKDEEYFIT